MAFNKKTYLCDVGDDEGGFLLYVSDEKRQKIVRELSIVLMFVGISTLPKRVINVKFKSRNYTREWKGTGLAVELIFPLSDKLEYDISELESLLKDVLAKTYQISKKDVDIKPK